MNHLHRDDEIKASWELNGSAWTTAVREHLIPSRRAGTDAAILASCSRLKPDRVLDVGCGEGWLTRALSATCREVVGIDASSALLDEARSASNAHYEVAEYETLIGDASRLPGPWDLIVCNYSLLGDPLAPLLAALGGRLSLTGRLLIQTVHPWTTNGEGPYADGWREESFATFGPAFPAAMPWFYRTLASWIAELQRAGLVIWALEEPPNPATGQPLSLLFECGVKSKAGSH